ncbi:MAG: ABC transporter ATP-binding protein [Clostridia bacterium]|nr:ABC transporter ATP-binding protein [Clostridia bacterium]
MEKRVPAVRMIDITKTFGHVTANNHVNLEIYRGEILALLGENGSGKTTLMNMLSGIYYPDSGSIEVDGKPVVIDSPKTAFSLGIGMIHQHFKLVNVLTAAENIELGGKGRLHIRDAARKIDEICAQYGFEVDPNRKVYDMSVSEKQTVEIIKVLYRGADILILDEPTAVLTPQETEKLFKVLRNMRNNGKAIVIITHKMNEVLAISDRVAVLRKGEYVGDLETAETTASEMTNKMVGHAIKLNIDRPKPVNPQPRILVEGLTVRNSDGVLKLKDVSFEARSGEILGIAGIAGSGQKELLESIAGLQRVESGSIVYLDDDGTREELVGKAPLEIQHMGVHLSFVPEDRLGMGLVGSMNIADNMMLRTYREGPHLFTQRANPAKTAEQVVRDLEVVTPSIRTPVRQLSGGNVQKVLVGREIVSAPKVLLTAYAVRGLDINSSYTIYHLLNEQKQKGVAVIYVGEDLDVLIQLADRILVLCDGQVSGIVKGTKAKKKKLGRLMTTVGGKEDGDEDK